MVRFSFWQRLPVVVRSVVIGALMATAGTLPWAFMAFLNIKYWPAVPWAVVPTALYLWIYWRFATGTGWPHSGASTRKTLCRANKLPGEVMGTALFAGALGLVSLVLFLNVINRMVRLPQHPTNDVSNLPFATLFLLLIMSALVAGVTEEASFRGYMQGPIEQRHGPVFAIMLTGSLFGFAHFVHPEVTLTLLPYYIAVAAVYGTIAYLTNSILPGIILHAGGNMLASFELFTGGRSEWQAPVKPAPLVWKSGADSSFWISAVIAAIVIGITIRAYHSLAIVAKHHLAIEHITEES